MRRPLKYSLVVLAVTSGCILPRSHSPLSGPAFTDKVALLPASSGYVAETSPKKLLQLANRILDTLSSSATENLIGPTECGKLVSIDALEHLSTALADRSKHESISA